MGAESNLVNFDVLYTFPKKSARKEMENQCSEGYTHHHKLLLAKVFLTEFRNAIIYCLSPPLYKFVTQSLEQLASLTQKKLTYSKQTESQLRSITSQ